MSSESAIKGLNTSQISMISGLIRTGEVARAKELLKERKPEDVEAFVNKVISEDWSTAEDTVDPGVVGQSGTSAPTGANMAESLMSGGTGFTMISNPAPENVKPGFIPAPHEEISETELRGMWKEWDEFDTNALSSEVIDSFKYQGFNPDEIMKSLMRKKKQSGVDNPTFLRDMSTLCALAVIKGSITDNNLKKMSDKGKEKYDELEKRYGITRGGGKGKPAEVITIARVAAAFPGKIVQMIQNKQVPGRQFVGELNTHKLPGVMQHQALAACVPQKMDDAARTYLLNLVTAYSVDQTRIISKVKVDTATLLERQKQFTDTSHNGMYPPEAMRNAIMKRYNWNELFPMIAPVAEHIKSKWPEFSTVSQTDFIDAVRKIP